MSTTSFVTPATNGPAIEPAHESAPAGLTNEDARARLEKDGPNAMPDTSAHPLRNALAKFWAPVPWLLEASVVLEIVLHKYYEAAVIAALLLFNAALAYFQESRAQATLAALKSRLALNASVQRDGEWKTVPAAELVCGDLVKLSLGGVVAADVHLTAGSVELDQSMLTGESLPIDAGAGTDTFAGALVRRGEATAIVTATGNQAFAQPRLASRSTKELLSLTGMLVVCMRSGQPSVQPSASSTSPRSQVRSKSIYPSRVSARTRTSRLRRPITSSGTPRCLTRLS